MLKAALLITGFCVFSLSGCASNRLESLPPGATASTACQILLPNPQSFLQMVNHAINIDLGNADRVSWIVESITPDYAHATKDGKTGWVACPAIASMSSGYKISGSFILMPNQYQTNVIWESDDHSVDTAVASARHAADAKKYGDKEATEWEAATKSAYANWVACLERVSRQGVRLPTEDGGVLVLHDSNLVEKRRIEECGIKPSYPRPPKSLHPEPSGTD